MSAPAVSRSPRPGHGLAVDEDEMRRWLVRLMERGYSEHTARVWISRIRIAYAHGVRDDGAVDAVLVSYANTTRSSIRQALRALAEFREVAR